MIESGGLVVISECEKQLEALGRGDAFVCTVCDKIHNNDSLGPTINHMHICVSCWVNKTGRGAGNQVTGVVL